MPGPRDPRSLAVDHFMLVDRLVLEAGSGKALRSRVREAPGIILDTGLAGFLTFYASKSREPLASAVHDALVGGDGVEAVKARLGGDYQDLLESLGKEGGGYDVVLAMVTAFLEANGLLRGGGGYLRRVADTVKGALDDPSYAAAATRLVLEYLEYVKRLVEARVKEGGD